MRTALCVKFPDHQGKYRELSRFRPPWGPNWDQISLVFSRVFDEIPYSTEQGIILEEQGIFRCNRDFSGRSREIHLAGGAARNSCVFGVDGVLKEASGGSRVSFRYLKRPDMRNRRVYLSAGATAVSRRRCSSPAQRSARIPSATSSATPSLPSSGKESRSRTTTSFADGTTTTYWPLCPVAAYASVGTPGHMRRDRSSGAPALSHQKAPY